MFLTWKPAAVATLWLASSLALGADEPPDATVDFSSGSVGAVAGTHWGAGTLHYHGVDYPFEFTGVSAGEVGAKGTWGTGDVYHLSKLEDFPGYYNAASLGIAVVGGATAAALSNDKGVVVHVKGGSIGLNVSLSISGVEIRLKAKN